MGRRRLEEEFTNRLGRWCRIFSVRNDCWIPIEHWAAENGYRLVQIRTRKRLYRKTDNPWLHATFIEVKQDESRITISAWIEAGSLLRACYLFTVSRELPLEPTGWKTARLRRRACHEMNTLLARLRQQPIVGSGGLHLVDLDPTIALFTLIALTFVGYVIYKTVPVVELRKGLSNSLLQTVGKQVGWLLGFAGGLALIHFFGIIKFLGSKSTSQIPKWASFAVAAVLFTVVSTKMLTSTVWELQEKKIVHECLLHFNSDRCNAQLAQLTPEQRKAMASRIEQLYGHIAY